MIEHWLVFACRPGKEFAAAKVAAQHGHIPNVPVIKSSRKGPSTRRKRQPVPAILGYVPILMEDKPKAIRQILALEFIGGDKCVTRRIPGKVTQEEMGEFLSYLTQLKEETAGKQWKAGDKVTLQDGRISGTVASVGKGKVNILIALFNSTRTVSVKAELVELVTALEKNHAINGKRLQKAANQSNVISREFGGRSATGGNVSHTRQSHRARLG